MSRSKRKRPFVGMTTARSDKPYKVSEHKRERRVVRSALAAGTDGDDSRLHDDYGNPWAAPKDGKQMVDPHSKWVRK